MQWRLRRSAMDGGVTLVAPETVYLSADTRIGRDVIVEPNVTFGPGVTVGEGARICSFSHLEGAAVGAGARVGPFDRLRPGAVLGDISSLCDDAAFPGYPFLLSVADRLAACPSWVRDDTWARIDSLLAESGIEEEVRERAFTDRHRLMERR